MAQVITSQGGNITVTADDDILMSGVNADISSNNGTVLVKADADEGEGGADGALTMVDGAVVNSGTGTVTMSADEDVVLGSVVSTNTTAAAIAVTSTSGAILDAGDAASEIIAMGGGAAAVTLKAATGIGNVIPGGSTAADAALEMQATTIAADTTVGDANIDNDTSAAPAAAVLVNSFTTGNGNVTFDQTGGGDITFVKVRAMNGSGILTNTDPVADPNIIVGDIFASNRLDITADGSIWNDGIVGTDITAPIAVLEATTGTIGVWNMPVEVDVNGGLYVTAGGMEDDWLSVNLVGSSNTVLYPDDAVIPGLLLFNTEQPGAPLENGTPVYMDNFMSNSFFQGFAQFDDETDNEVWPYELYLDVYGDTVFAPDADLVGFAGAGVKPLNDEGM